MSGISLQQAQLEDLGRQLNQAFEILKEDRKLFDELKQSSQLSYEMFDKCYEAKKRIDEFMGKEIALHK